MNSDLFIDNDISFNDNVDRLNSVDYADSNLHAE